MILRKETETKTNLQNHITLHICIRMNDTPQGDNIITMIKK